MFIRHSQPISIRDNNSPCPPIGFQNWSGTAAEIMRTAERSEKGFMVWSFWEHDLKKGTVERTVLRLQPRISKLLRQ